MTDYTLEINDSATDDSPFEHGFDGDADGEAGGSFILSFSTSPADIMAPISSDVFPSSGVGFDQFRLRPFDLMNHWIPLHLTPLPCII